MNTRAVCLVATVLWLGGEAQAADASWLGKALESPTPPLTAGDRFGATLAIGNNLIAVGAYLADTSNGTDSGAVYFYRWNGTSWEPYRTELGEAGDQLGFDLAIDIENDGTTTLLAGAPFARTGGVRCGVVRHFSISEDCDEPDGICEKPRIEPPAEDREAGAEFGSAVVIKGTIIAVGARGEDGRRGRIYASFRGERLHALDVNADVGEGDELGTSLTTDGRWLVAGAPFADAQGNADSGAAYVFAADQPLGQVLLPPPQHGQARAAFGYSLAFHRDSLAVGAPLEDGPGADSGAVHLFRKEPWTEMSVAPGAGAGHQFGVSVASGDSGLFAGARRAQSGKGAVYPIVNGVRQPAAILSPNLNAREGDEFGFGVAVAPREALLVVGAFMEANAAGAAYVFKQQQEPEPPRVPTISFVNESMSVGEAAGKVTPEVRIVTADGGRLQTGVEVELDFCPPESGCTATKWIDYRPLAPPTIPANTETDSPSTMVHPFPLAMVEILPDVALEGPEILTIRLRLKPGSQAELGQRRLLRITIDDSHLVLSPGSLRTRERGLPVGFQVRLASPPIPTAEVTVILTTTDATEGTVSPSRLKFTPDDWNQDQPVTLTPVDDPLCDGTQAFAIEVKTRSVGDPSYRDLSQSIPAENEDDERPCLAAAKSVCAYPDNTVVYTIELTNLDLGMVAAHLEDPLPSELSVVTASADSGVATVDYLGNSVVWDGTAPAPGDRVTITVVAALDPVPVGTDVGNQGTLSWVRDDGSMATALSDDPATPEPADATFFDALAGDLAVGCPP